MGVLRLRPNLELNETPSLDSVVAERNSSAVPIFLLFGGAFTLLQVLLAAANAGMLARYLIVDPVSGYDPVSTHLVARLPVAGSLAASTYLLAALPLILAAQHSNYRWLLPIVPILYVLLSGPGASPIGLEWRTSCENCPWFAAEWFGPLLDVVLVSGPAFWVARKKPSSSADSLPSADLPNWVAAVSVGALLMLTFWAFSSYGDSVEVGAFVSAGLIAIWIGEPSLRWAAASVATVLWLSGGVREVAAMLMTNPQYGFPVGWGSYVQSAWPLATVMCVGAMRYPLRRAFLGIQQSPLAMLIAINVLNVVDAVATWLGVTSGNAVEVNPVVQTIGLPVKLALVFAASWAIFRKQPQSLLVPLAAMGLVAAYHCVGAVLG